MRASFSFVNLSSVAIMTIWKASPQKTSPRRRVKTCESCGKAFVCHQGGCWCDALKLAHPTLEALQMKYQDCLCEDCLKSVVISPSPK